MALPRKDQTGEVAPAGYRCSGWPRAPAESAALTDLRRCDQIERGQPQRHDDRNICSGHRVVGQFMAPHPGQRLTFTPDRLTFPGIDPVDIQQHAAIGIVMGDADQRPVRDDLDAQFLVQLRASPAATVSPGSSLPPGNSQSPWWVSSCRLASKHPAGIVDQGGSGDMDDRAHATVPFSCGTRR